LILMKTYILRFRSDTYHAKVEKFILHTIFEGIRNILLKLMRTTVHKYQIA